MSSTDDDSTNSPLPTGSIPTVRPTTSATTTVPPSQGPSVFGRPCQADGECADGLRCVTSDSSEWLSGGPAHGYCTFECAADPNACAQFDSSAQCLGFESGSAYCMQACVGGDQPTKCHDRVDLACVVSADDISPNPVGFCRPVCRYDEDCDGRACDLGSGLCVDAVEGDPVGSACDPDPEATNTCASGICYGGIEPGYGMCSGLCNLSQSGCGSDPDAPGAPGSPICLLPLAETFGSGDVGLCNQTCECDEQCLHPDAVCLLLAQSDSAAGFVGACVRPGFADDNELPVGATFGRSCPSPEAGVSVDASTPPATPSEAGTPADASTQPGLELDAATDAQVSSEVDASFVSPADASPSADASGDR